MVTKPGLAKPAGITPKPGLVYPYGQITQRLVGWTYLDCFPVRIPGLFAGESFDGTRSAKMKKRPTNVATRFLAILILLFAMPLAIFTALPTPADSLPASSASAAE